MTERAWLLNSALLLTPRARGGGGGGGGEGSGAGGGSKTTTAGGEKRGNMLIFIVAALSLLVRCTCDTATSVNEEGSSLLRPVANLSATETGTAIVLSWQEAVQTNSSDGGGAAAQPQPSVYYQISASADGGGWLQLGRCSRPCSQLTVSLQGAAQGAAATGTRHYNFSVVAYSSTVAASAPAFAALNVTAAGTPVAAAAAAGLIAGITAAVVIASGLTILGSLRIVRLLRDRAARRRCKSDGSATNGSAHGTLPRRLLESTSPDLQRVRRSERLATVGSLSAKDSRVFLTNSSGHFGSTGTDSDAEFGYYSSYWRNRSSNATYQNLESLHSTRCSAADTSAAIDNYSGAQYGSHVISRLAADDDRWSSKLASHANHAGHYNCGARRSSSSQVSSDLPSVLDASSSDRRTGNPTSRAAESASGRQCAGCPPTGFCRSRDAVCCPLAAAPRRTAVRDQQQPPHRGTAHRQENQRILGGAPLGSLGGECRADYSAGPQDAPPALQQPRSTPPHRGTTHRQENQRKLDSLGGECRADYSAGPQDAPPALQQPRSTPPHAERSANGGASESFVELNGSDISLLGNVELRDSFIPLRFFSSSTNSNDNALSPRHPVATDASNLVGAKQLASVSSGHQYATSQTLAGECLSSAVGSDSTDEARAPIGCRSQLRGYFWDPKSLAASPTAFTRGEWQLPKQSRDDDLGTSFWTDCFSPPAAVDVLPPTLAAVYSAAAPASLHRPPLASPQLSSSKPVLTEEGRLKQSGPHGRTGGRLPIARELTARRAVLPRPLAYSSPAIRFQPPPVSINNVARGAFLPCVSPPPHGTSLSSSLSLASSSSRTERYGREENLRRATADTIAARTKVGDDTKPPTANSFRGCLESGRHPNLDSRSSFATARQGGTHENAGWYRAATEAAHTVERPNPVEPFRVSASATNSGDARRPMCNWQSAASVLPPAAYRDVANLNFYEKTNGISVIEYTSPQPATEAAPWPEVGLSPDASASKAFDSGANERSNHSQKLSPPRSETPPWERYSKTNRAASSPNGSATAGSADDTAQSQTVMRPDVARVETLLRELHAYQNSSTSCRDLCMPFAAEASSVASSHKLRPLETEM